jgi:uncharacterized protein (DUF1015 family)
LAQISAFNGIRYGKQFDSKLKDVTAPPYDVLSKEQVTQLHLQSEFNITHLTRPLSYESAAKLWERWRTDRILAEDKPSLYIYSQTFIDPETGKQMPARLGLICALHLEDYSSGKVVPHENTIAAHRADRLELMRTTHANLESIYGLYSDSSRSVLNIIRAAAKTAPVIGTVENILGSDHKLQQVTDLDVIKSLQSALSEKSILIADGHHRYETALAYERDHKDEPGAGSILITLTAFEDDGLLVLPTHRLVRGLDDATVQSLPEKLGDAGFIVTRIDSSEPALSPGTFGFDMLTAQGLFRALLPRGTHPSDLIKMDHCAAWKSLDVSILSALVLEGILGIPIDSLATTDQVRYTRDAAEAHQKVNGGEFQAAFLLSRPTMEGIQAVGDAGEKMPQKSTFFYPKLLSGLVMRSLL